ncbi:MAG: aspartyl/asparaginyl beta-hydroxylase domain-containing protein, partial [Steroidobacteraceae bacterium]|nr:aspartyl/asparaginyl beta-hydroxylase domain-containing protein [Steroidobacteraceae bacterium]
MNVSPLRDLVQRVERATAAGRRTEAAALLAEAQAIDPDHPLVLNAHGMLLLHGGDAQAARERLQRAIAADDRNPAFWLNLAACYRQLGLRDDEAAALQRVLALDPRHLLALLQKASLLEIQGKPRAAAAVYKDALATLPPGYRPPAVLEAALAHAQQAVRANDAALEEHLERRLASLRARYAESDHSRFDHCLHALVGKRRIYTPQPTFLHFPALPCYEFYPRADFPWLDAIEAAWSEIRDEFERVFAEDAGRFVPYVQHPEGVPLDQWAELNHSRRWSVFYLWHEGRAITENIARCPRTVELLANVPKVDIGDHGPAVFFSILDAKSRIPPHTGVTNTRLIVHLPLIVPPHCAFRVGSQTRVWEPGKAWVFDDTIEHEAWNDSDVPRAVLIFDIWNPYLTAAERELVRATVEAFGEFYRPPAAEPLPISTDP